MRRLGPTLAPLLLAACLGAKPTGAPPIGASDCGPLASDPPACGAAVQSAIRLLQPGVAWVSVRVTEPLGDCSSAAGPCRRPQVVVEFYAVGQAAPVANVGLVQSGSEWVSVGQLR